MKYFQIHLKIQSWLFLATSVTFIQWTCSINFKPSPCPAKFSYESTTNDDRWYGDINFPVNATFEGSTIRIELDRPSQLLVTTAGPITTKDNQVYFITHDNVVLERGSTYKLIFMVKFDKESDIPMLATIHFNGQRICPPDLVSLSLNGGNDYSTPRPDIKATAPTDVISDIDKRPNTPTRTTTTSYNNNNQGIDFHTDNANVNRITTRIPNPNNFNNGGSNFNNFGNSNNNGNQEPNNGFGNNNHANNGFNSGNSNNFGNTGGNFGTNTNPNQGNNGFNSGNSNSYGGNYGTNSNQNQGNNGFSSGNSNTFGGNTGNFGTNSNPNQGNGGNNGFNNFGGGGQGNSIKNPNQGNTVFNNGGGSSNFGNGGNNGFSGGSNLGNEATVSSEIQCGTVSIANPLITLAQNTEYGQWPWHVALFMKDEGNPSKSSYICGGSLVSKNRVITAAHCVSLSGNRIVNPNSLTVYLGKYNINADESTSQKKAVVDLRVNPKYNRANFHDDIAILNLNSDAEYTNYVRPICLWEAVDGIQDVVGKDGIVAGWGYNEHQQLNQELKQATMPIVSADKCARSDAPFFAEYVSENAFCAGSLNGTGPCKGDSGGGLVVKRNNTWFLRGIVSVSAAPKNGSVCNNHHYIVFTDVARYTDFIRQNL